MKQKDYSHLSIEEQIKKFVFRIKFLKIFGVCWSISVIIAAMLLWGLVSEWQLAVSFLITLPLSIYLGGVLQIKEYKKKIEKLLKEEQHR